MNNDSNEECSELSDVSLQDYFKKETHLGSDEIEMHRRRLRAVRRDYKHAVLAPFVLEESKKEQEEAAKN